MRDSLIEKYCKCEGYTYNAKIKKYLIRTNVSLRKNMVVCFLFAVLFCVLFPHQSIALPIPYVDCSADNPLSSQLESSHRLVEVGLSASVASKLSFYAGDFTSVLGPRGWSCSENLGGDGGILLVYPLGGYVNDGPSIEASEVSAVSQDGGYDTEEYVCRYFENTDYNSWNGCKNGAWYPPGSSTPASFVNSVPNYPKDKLIYINAYLIQYHTDEGELGLGSSSLFDPTTDVATLKKINPSQISTDGFLAIGMFSKGKNISSEGLMQLFKVRMPYQKKELQSIILSFAKSCFLNDADGLCRSKDLNNLR